MTTSNFKKDSVQQKKQSSEWNNILQNGKKMFANHIFDKGLMCKIEKEIIKLNSKKKVWF